VRSGVIEPESYLELLARNISRLLRGSGRHKQSLADSSVDAWTKFYKQDENAPNAIVSYYTKGAVVALMLDLKIRLDTNGEKSLDDVMRELWRRYGRTGIGVSEEDVEPLIEEVTGLDLSSFFDNALRGTGHSRKSQSNSILWKSSTSKLRHRLFRCRATAAKCCTEKGITGRDPGLRSKKSG